MSATKLIDYRNGIYQGQTKGNQKQGQGILITDRGSILIGNWKADKLDGEGAIFYSNQQYGFGEFRRGEIDGQFMFRNSKISLYGEFNNSVPLEKMLYMDYQADRVKILRQKSPIYEVVSEDDLQKVTEKQLISKHLQRKFNCRNIITYLKEQLIEKCQGANYFKLITLPNGHILFKFNDPRNPINLGLIIGKEDKIISFGSFINDKLTGFGFKNQNSIIYQGEFENGFLNGVGIKCVNNKYSFGSFQSGNFVEAVFVDDRSGASLEKLKQYQKIQHLKSQNYYNGYVKYPLLKFKGIEQIRFQNTYSEDILYSHLKNQQSSPKQKLMSIINSRNPELTSQKSTIMKRNPEEQEKTLKKQSQSQQLLFPVFRTNDL